MITETSVIIPALNEERFLQGTVEDALDYLGEGSELIIVTDPSSDRTEDIAATLSEKHSAVIHVKRNEGLGKGRAIEEGIEKASCSKIAFMDADNATTPDQLQNIIEPVESGFDLAIGSRYLRESDTKRKRYREVPSKVFNFFTSKVLGTGIKDHQCGFKAFKKEELESLISLEDGGFPWDLELLYKASKRGMKIKEVPVKWRSKKGSEVTAKTYLSFIKRIYFLSLDRFFGDKSQRIHKYGKFAVIGALGAFINTLLLYLLTDIAGLHYMVSGALSIEAAIIAMFFLNNQFTFTPVKRGLHQIINGLIVSNIVRSVGIVAQLAILYLLTDYFGMYYLISNIIAIFISSILTFIGENRYNWNQ